MNDRLPHNTDLSDMRWVLIEPVILAWKARHPPVSGHECRYPMREIVNALIYQAPDQMPVDAAAA